MTTRGIGAPNASHPEPVVPTGQKPLADVADAVKPEHAIRARVLLVVEVAEVAEVTLKDRVELIPAPVDVAMT